MSTLARIVVALLGAVVALCAFVPWTLASTAAELPARTLLATRSAELGTFATSLAVPLLVAAAVVVAAALLGSRAGVLVGGLLCAGIPLAWILVNALAPHGPATVELSAIRAGAYVTAVSGIFIVLVAALSADTRRPSAR